MLKSMGLQRVGHNIATENQQQSIPHYILYAFYFREYQERLRGVYPSEKSCDTLAVP